MAVSNCDPDELLAQAACFDKLTDRQLRMVTVFLLCNLVQNAGPPPVGDCLLLEEGGGVDALLLEDGSGCLLLEA